ncbi:MAG: TIGR03617 family F420-dependent LLM class oxidoreductase [Anaerolineales bacterium]|nr:TIGR03617 family F420-dependent LLM class oxidoreductase [Anaerolineales bacterium]
MKFDAGIPPLSLSDIPQLARTADDIGFDALWTSETQHDPFLPLALVSEHSRELRIGTAVAIAFARSPATLAYTSWDLAQSSGGRFILGLGTQVRAHIERRFGMPWPTSPVGKLREFVRALRAFWTAWQTGERLNFRSESYKITLMSPFFNPGPIENPEIPIFIAGVNVGLCRLAGEVADGFIAHPYHSEQYLREVVRPAIAEGAMRAGREAERVALSVSAMTVMEPEDADFVRSQIAFYASTPTYRPVMAYHGWGEVADQLQVLSRKQAWGEMTNMIDEDMLDTFAVVAPPDEIAKVLKKRYHDLADRLSLYLPFLPGQRDDFWRNLVASMQEG